MRARDELTRILRESEPPAVTSARVDDYIAWQQRAAGRLQAWIKRNHEPRRRPIMFEECESLPDGSAILTPGKMILRKYDGYFGPGETGWDRGSGYEWLRTDSLDPDAHFPAHIIYYEEGAA